MMQSGKDALPGPSQGSPKNARYKQLKSFVSSNNSAAANEVAEQNVDEPPNRDMEVQVNENDLAIANVNANVPVNRITNTEAFIHLLKIMIGLGLLEIPHAVAHAGLLLGTISIPVIGAFTLYCTHLLINNSVKLSQTLSYEYLKYEETAEEAFKLVPRLQSYATCFGSFVEVMLIITEIAVCSDYMLFVGRSLQEVCNNMTDHDHPLGLYLLIAMIPLLPLSYIKDLNNLIGFSKLGIFIQVIGFFIVLVICIVGPHNYDIQPFISSFKSTPLCFGIALHAFENIALILPVRSVMADPLAMSDWFGVLNVPVFISAILYTSMGFFGYLKYGNDIDESISFNLPAGTAWGETGRVAFAVAILLSYPLQMYLPAYIIWDRLCISLQLNRLNDGTKRACNISLRTILVILTFLIGFAVAGLDTLVSFIGSVCSTLICLIIPQIIDMCYLLRFKDGDPYYMWKITRDLVCFMIGCFLFVSGVYAAIVQYISEEHRRV